MMNWTPEQERYYYTDVEGQTHQYTSDSQASSTIPRSSRYTTHQLQEAVAGFSTNYAQTQQLSGQLVAGQVTSYPQPQQQFPHGAGASSTSYTHAQQHQLTSGSPPRYTHGAQNFYPPDLGSPANFTPQQPYQPISGSSASYSQTQPQLFYHQTLKQYHEQQAEFHLSREGYCISLPYINDQYYQEQEKHHVLQAQFHQKQGAMFPTGEVIHQSNAEYHQNKARFYAQPPSHTPQQQAADHRRIAEYHQRVAAYHQQQLESQTANSQGSPQSPQHTPYARTTGAEYTQTTNPQIQPMVPAGQIRTNTPGESEPLDPTYRVEPRPRRYFAVGRVFHVLWTEPTNKAGNGTEYTQIRFGEHVYSDIRRFVVVKEVFNASWCLPIQTYGKQATTKASINQKDHAVIYTDSYPGTLPGEMLTKSPLRVIPESPDLKLDPTSRINFGKIYTVEHNVKVKRLGKIADECMVLLKSYWNEGRGASAAVQSD